MEAKEKMARLNETAAEIADMLGISTRQVFYLLAHAEAEDGTGRTPKSFA